MEKNKEGINKLSEQSRKDLVDGARLAEKITELLPRKPSNVGIPIVALKLATANYIEYIRENLSPDQHEFFESLLRQTDVMMDSLAHEMYKKK